MSVRGSKNKIILYIAAVSSILFLILLYQNASQKLEAMEKAYERCHLNEESLSAQLQVNLEYKVRLEKSLQLEKSEHTQVKEELQNKLDEEKQGREREISESNRKFSALQQQYTILQTRHEDVNQECSKIRQAQLKTIEEKRQLEIQIQHLTNELKMKERDFDELKAEYSRLEREVVNLGKDELRKINGPGTQIKLPENVANASLAKTENSKSNLQQPDANRQMDSASLKSPTPSKKAGLELLPSGVNRLYLKTSTPMINPDAVNSQDKILSVAPVPQPKQEPFQQIQDFGNKESVGAKPEQMAKENPNDMLPPQGDILNDFGHVPAIQLYKEKLKEGMKRYDNGEVHDEQQMARNEMAEDKQLWREGEVQGVPFVQQPAVNEIPKNPAYHYQAEYDGRKEEGEDDDDVDPLDYHNEKNQQAQEQQQHQGEKPLVGIPVKIPFEDKRESVMIQPK